MKESDALLNTDNFTVAYLQSVQNVNFFMTVLHSYIDLKCYNIDLDEWNRNQYKFTSCGFGKWELTIPPQPEGTCRIPHNSLVKVQRPFTYTGVALYYSTSY